MRRAGLKIRPYDLRHDLAARGALTGMSNPQLRDLIGHKSLAMTNHYTQLFPGHLDQAVKAIEFTGTFGTGDELVMTAGERAEEVIPEVVGVGTENSVSLSVFAIVDNHPIQNGSF
jgi:hypothetical protein